MWSEQHSPGGGQQEVEGDADRNDGEEKIHAEEGWTDLMGHQ